MPFVSYDHAAVYLASSTTASIAALPGLASRHRDSTRDAHNMALHKRFGQEQARVQLARSLKAEQQNGAFWQKLERPPTVAQLEAVRQSRERPWTPAELYDGTPAGYGVPPRYYDGAQSHLV